MGWIGTILGITGAWQLRFKHRYAFLLMMLANVCWAIEGWRIQKPELIVINSVMFCIGASSYYHWGKE